MSEISWSYFAFGVPDGWQERHEGDSTYWYESDQRRLYAEVFTGCGDRGHPKTPPPKFVTLGADGHGHGTVNATSTVTVPGAEAGWRYELTDSTGPAYSAVNVWIPPACNKELWLVVSAPPAIVDQIVATIVAQPNTVR